MSTNLDRFKTDVTKLIVLGSEMALDLSFRDSSRKTDAKERDLADKVKGSFEKDYQRWYTEACAVFKQLMPDRLAEFISLYHGNGKRKQIDSTTYNIQDWLNGIRSGEDFRGKKHYNDFAIVSRRLLTQLQIFESVESRFQSSLFDIQQLVRADLFDSELDAARELAKNGFLRAAGAVAGVVIEKHLAQVCMNHNITKRKQHPTISDFDDLLKSAGVLDVPAWRQIQRLGDIRNLCDHNKVREPTKDEVVELVEGTDKLCKTLF
ncbi:MAG: hypothetical protein M3N48_07265 [Verrucomicrobiota bacterium]|nr:hypothetical protein [Verrucomicrobiota bacterium]